VWWVAVALFFPGEGLMFAQSYAAASDVFEQTGSLSTGRYGHSAILLPNGKVLVVGGRTGFPSGIILASAELYDPESGTWTATGSLGGTRWIHTATLLPSGKVLVAGGQGSGGYLASAELYDPESGTWTATGSLGIAHCCPAATLLPDGRVLLVGGLNSSGALASAELYDPTSGNWTATGSLATARNFPNLTLLPNGNVLSAGGISASGSTLASAELYDLASGAWTATGSLATASYFHTATLLPDDNVLVAGGYADNNIDSTRAELYDPGSGAWTATGNLATAREGHTASLLPNGTVLVVGGGANTAELYNPATGTWTVSGSTLTPRNRHTATLLRNGKVLIAGGFAGNCCPAFASAELYVGQPVSPALLNISTRMRVLTGNNVLIGGFIVTGTDLKRVLIRGIGPSLTGVGITLPDPTLELHQGGMTIATNDDWKTRPDGTSQRSEIEATGIPPTNDLESAILMTLSPGAYTAILAGKNEGIGVGLVEIYDLGQGANSKLANISTRGFVDAGDNVMIGGVIVGGGSGGGSARVLVRALGPSVLVAGALGDPTLELHDGSGALIASNDNWKTRPDGTSQQAEIEATGIAPTNDLESALVQTLTPGNYTAIVRGTNNTTGVGLAEVYNLQ
jgi:WD40 repeat protein